MMISAAANMGLALTSMVSGKLAIGHKELELLEQRLQLISDQESTRRVKERWKLTVMTTDNEIC